ncbi:D-alanyl-D-alanine carboxypeptidase/D-alanyl-D-alanine-endopeptidase [Streptomyces sp. TR06-5]|uniref:D-alanyl-D-alanine carboxypeptidase/D-alanyl-D-alanine endopeptidase n=1 Tax=unclassified Streptomyces TaxID=2593676 RepID=UPI0039A0B27B
MPDTTYRARSASADGSSPHVTGGLRARWRSAPPRQRQTWRLSVTSGVVGLAVACTAIAVSGPWDSGQRTAERVRAGHVVDGSGEEHTPTGPEGLRPAPSAPAVLHALRAPRGDSGTSEDAAAPAPAPNRAALADALRPLLKDGALGSSVTASVVDTATGARLFGRQADRPVVPASTIKLATSVAVLTARGPDHRIGTPVVRTADGRVVLVGGGDPTLTEDDLADLARDTAQALRQSNGGAGRPKVRVGYDVSLWSGPVQHPIGRNENLAPVTPLTVNEGRLDDSHHGPAPRATDPSADAARTFARQLSRQGVAVSGTPEKVTAGGKAEPLAEHRSATLRALVERMLTYSDNDLAEALARQTAVATGRPADFRGAGRAVHAQLRKQGLPVQGAHFADGSGLDRADKVTARLLTSLLTRAAAPGHPELRTILTGMPVAHFTGTLGSRYGGEHGAGVVRAKTGTLTGINTLAGTVADADGRLLAFAFTATGTADPAAAKNALDRLASALADCGCR